MRKIIEVPDSTFSFTITLFTEDNGQINGHIAAVSRDDFYKDVIEIKVEDQENDTTEGQ